MSGGSEHLWQIVWQFCYDHLVAPLGRSWVGRTIAKGVRLVLDEIFGNLFELIGERAARWLPNKESFLGIGSAVVIVGAMALVNWEASSVLQNRYYVIVPIILTLIVTTLCICLLWLTLHVSDPLFNLGTIGGAIVFLVMLAEVWASICLFVTTGPALMHAWVTGDYFGTLFDFIHLTAFFVQTMLVGFPILLAVLFAPFLPALLAFKTLNSMVLTVVVTIICIPGFLLVLGAIDDPDYQAYLIPTWPISPAHVNWWQKE